MIRHKAKGLAAFTAFGVAFFFISQGAENVVLRTIYFFISVGNLVGGSYLLAKIENQIEDNAEKGGTE